MTANETDEMEHGSEAATAPDFEQTFAGIASSAFSEGKVDGFSELMQSQPDDAVEAHDVTAEADNSALIAGLPVMMKVVLGSAKMPVATLAKLTKGSVVKLDKMVGDSVDILVNGRLIARGEVVVLNEAQSRFGVVLTQVGKLSPAAK